MRRQIAGAGRPLVRGDTRQAALDEGEVTALLKYIRRVAAPPNSPIRGLPPAQWQRHEAQSPAVAASQPPAAALQRGAPQTFRHELGRGSDKPSPPAAVPPPCIRQSTSLGVSRAAMQASGAQRRRCAADWRSSVRPRISARRRRVVSVVSMDRDGIQLRQREDGPRQPALRALGTSLPT
ncbi:hypothetical protein CDD83_9001 [Cordyceps sp. RAO-2017]|nr:hypothetical protein CDD83_9001 [Cordyceps sp. RAO-2017]